MIFILSLILSSFYTDAKVHHPAKFAEQVFYKSLKSNSTRFMTSAIFAEKATQSLCEKKTRKGTKRNRRCAKLVEEIAEYIGECVDSYTANSDYRDCFVGVRYYFDELKKSVGETKEQFRTCVKAGVSKSDCVRNARLAGYTRTRDNGTTKCTTKSTAVKNSEACITGNYAVYEHKIQTYRDLLRNPPKRRIKRKSNGNQISMEVDPFQVLDTLEALYQKS